MPHKTHALYRTFALQAALLASTVIVSAAPWESQADDWPQFRGPNCTGISTGTQPLPAQLSLDKNLRWSAEVGDGVGGAIVVEGRVFVSGMTGSETVSLFAFDAATGKKLWQRDWPTGPLPEIHLTNSQASTTPAADGQRVYFYFTTLGLLAVDAQTGEDVWQQTLPVPFFVFKWGPGMSPVLYKDLVLFCQDDDLFPAMYAFDRATGSLRWKDERLDMAVNYSHPVVCSVDGRDDIVVGGTGLLVGYDPADGKRRWQAKVMLRNIKTTPVVRDGVVYISVQSGGIANQWLRSVDQAATGNNDGKLDKAEMQAFVGEQVIPAAFFEKTFDRGDLDRNGFLEGQELDLAFLSPENFAGATFTQLGDAAADEYVLAVRGGGEGDVTDSHLLWKHKTKYTDHIVSPLVDDGRMFLVKEGGITTVYDMAAGKSLRGAKRVGNGGNYFASPVVGDGKIYLVNENGDAITLKNDESYEVLSETNLGEPIISTPAIADGKIFVRTRTKVMCFTE